VTQHKIILAGATGSLGRLAAKHLRAQGADVIALVRNSSRSQAIKELKELGVTVTVVNFSSVDDIARACVGATCVISALAGLRETIIGTQSNLVDGAIKANVPRFIPSDFSIDFTKLAPGTNRNLDARREFHGILAQKPIKVTSVFNGAFTDMLTGQMPMILFKLRRILYWGDADQRLQFTTIDNTAHFTALAALDAASPRHLHIAGDQLTTRDLASVMTSLTGKSHKLLRAGSLGLLAAMIKIARTLSPQEDVLYPPWQGMQYFHNMLSGVTTPDRLDHERYPGIEWRTARDVLEEFLAHPPSVS